MTILPSSLFEIVAKDQVEELKPEVQAISQNISKSIEATGKETTKQIEAIPKRGIYSCRSTIEGNG